MAATGFSPIYLYASGTAGHIPLAANLTNTTNGSEIALNYADGNLFFKNASNSVITTPLLQASGSQNGWLSSTDWTTFNGKQAALVSGTNIKSLGGASLLGSGNLNNISDLGIGVAPYAANNALWINNDSGDSNNKFNIDGYANGLYINATSYSGAATGTSIILGTSTAALGYSVPRVIIFPAGGVSIGNTTDPGATTLAVNTATWSGPPASPKIWTTGGVAVGDSSNWVQLYQYGAYFSTSFYVVNTTPTGVYINSGSTAWSAYSDARLKTVTGKYETPLADINQLEPVKFTWNWDESKKPAVGLLAQSVEKVVPEAIDHAKLQNTDDETEYMSVRYSELIPLLVASIQELQAKLKAAGVAGF